MSVSDVGREPWERGSVREPQLRQPAWRAVRRDSIYPCDLPVHLPFCFWFPSGPRGLSLPLFPESVPPGIPSAFPPSWREDMAGQGTEFITLEEPCPSQGRCLSSSVPPALPSGAVRGVGTTRPRGGLPAGDGGPGRLSLCRRLPPDRPAEADGGDARPGRPAPPVPALPPGLQQLRSQLARAGEGNDNVAGGWWQPGGEDCGSGLCFWGLIIPAADLGA